MPELKGELTIWESEGGFGSSEIEIGGITIEQWLAEQHGNSGHGQG